MSDRKLFGTDGIRGRANIYPMTGEVAMALGRAVTYYFQKNNSNKKPLIIIGKDTRLSCYMLEQAFSAGVCSQGGMAILTGPLPTPGVAFVIQSMRADAGVMISASHNSFEDNGIKIFDHTGHKLPDDIELEFEKMILEPKLIPKKLDASLGRAKRLDEVNGRYIVHVKTALAPQYSLEGTRVVLDCANGASYKLAPMALEELGAEVFLLGNTPNGQNINKQCGALYPQTCADQVRTYRANIGICLDGDGDRLVVIDEKSNIVDGDRLIGLMAKFLKDKKELDPRAEVVGTVMSNVGLEIYLKNLGISFYRTKVGDRYIIERMLESGALFGGEPSGHLVFKKYSTTGDGLFAALKVLECIKYYNKPLSELVAEIELYPQVMKNLKVKEKKTLETIPSVAEAMKKAEEELKDKGRILVRYSGTENVLRVMVEARDHKLTEEVCDKLCAVIEAELGTK